MIGTTDENVGNSTISNCYNSGIYSSTSETGISGLLGIGVNCTFSNCFSMNYGFNPLCDSSVVYNNGTDTVDSNTLTNYASKLGDNYKTAPSNVNRRISIVSMAINIKKFRRKEICTKPLVPCNGTKK